MMISAETLAQTAGDHEARRAAMGAEIARLQAQVAELQALSVTRILIDVVPGDGSGQEVYAKSVADVVGLLSKLGERAEEADSLQAQVDALAGALRGLHALCTLALSDKTGKQFSYFETRAGTFVHAVEAMQDAESALASAGR